MVKPIGMPIIVVIRMAHNIPPFMFLTTNSEVIISPMIVRRPLPCVIDPKVTKVESFLMIIPAFCRPTNAINNPIPIVNDFLIVFGIISTMASRSLVNVRSNRMIPSIRIAVRANCHEYFIEIHTVNTKNALGPIPGAIPKGIRATKATNYVLIKATRVVVVNTAP